MARKLKKTATKKSGPKKPTKKPMNKKKGTKRISKTQTRKKVIKKSVRAAVKASSPRTGVVKKASKGLLRRAVEAVEQVVAPLMPSSDSEKPKVE